MKKDIFKGKIDKSCNSMVKISLFLQIFIFGLCGIFFFFIGIFAKNQENVTRLVLLIISGLCFLAAIICPLLTLFAIRTYPKHKKLAHLLLKEYVYETNISE